MTPPIDGPRPRRLAVVLGTGTEVGKTWVSARVLERLVEDVRTVAARKPAQSFAPEELEAEATDAHVLAAAARCAPEDVCPRQHWLGVPMAPPMATRALSRPPITLDELLAALRPWPGSDSTPVDVGLLETVGGCRSPLAEDADSLGLISAARPDRLLLVADAGLGTIDRVRLAADGIAAVGAADLPLLVVLNRFDPTEPLHRHNRAWLAERDSFEVLDATDAASVAAWLRSPP